MTNETTETGTPLPSTVGRYQIVGALGFGAMGAVYKAFDPIIKRTLAIKTIRLDIPRQSPQHASFIERFYREARISGTLSHPNIVTLFDIGEEAGAPFLAMEFVDGRTIASVIEEGQRFPPEKVVALVSQVAAALDYAHSRGVVHRDIKPSNLILFDADKVKVTDFGIAKLADSEITHAGVLLGTPAYMSPEQAMGEALDGRSDIFSLGVCAFEMLSGQQPFPGSNVTAILYRLVHVEPVLPPDLESLGLVSQKWREVFQTVLAKKPSDRYETATAFVRDLELCLGSWFAGLGEPTIRIEAPPQPPPATPPIPPDGWATSSRPSPANAEAAATLAVKRPPLPLPAASATPTPRPGVDTDPEGSSDAATVLMKAASSPAVGTDSAAAATALLRAPATGLVPETPTAHLEPLQLTTPLFPTATGARKKRRQASRSVWLVGAAAALLIGAGLGGWALLRRRAEVTPAALPAAAANPAVAAPRSPGNPAAVAASLFVESAPAGASVLLNGEARGVTPLALAGLAFGSYDVRVELKGFDPQRRTIAMAEGRPSARLRIDLARSVPPSGSASIVSSPSGAVVHVDGKLSGRTPLPNLTLKPGSHRVELALEGHESWAGKVEVLAGQKGSVEVKLRPRPKPAPTPEAVDVERIYNPNEVDVVPQRVAGPSPDHPPLKTGERLTVRVGFVVTAKGQTADIAVEQSGGAAADAVVVAAVRKWKYKPATKRNTPVNCRAQQTYTFVKG